MKNIAIQAPINPSSDVTGSVCLFQIKDTIDYCPLQEGYYLVKVKPHYSSGIQRDELGIYNKNIVAFYSQVTDEFYLPCTWRRGGFDSSWIDEIINPLSNDVNNFKYEVTDKDIKYANAWLKSNVNKSLL